MNLQKFKDVTSLFDLFGLISLFNVMSTIVGFF